MPNQHAATSLPLTRRVQAGPWRNISLVMFDLDGTLIDTMGHFADLAATLIQANYGVDWAVARRRYLQTSGIPFRQQLEVIFPRDERNESTAATYEEDKTEICLRADFPADTIAALATLQQHGIKVVVSSNSAQHFVDEISERASLRFDLALGFGGELAKGPTHVAKVEAHFGIGRENMLFVGDSLKDGELAAVCDQRFIGVAGTFRPADFSKRFGKTTVISRIAELPAILLGRKLRRLSAGEGAA